MIGQLQIGNLVIVTEHEGLQVLALGTGVECMEPPRQMDLDRAQEVIAVIQKLGEEQAPEIASSRSNETIELI